MTTFYGAYALHRRVLYAQVSTLW